MPARDAAGFSPLIEFDGEPMPGRHLIRVILDEDSISSPPTRGKYGPTPVSVM